MLRDFFLNNLEDKRARIPLYLRSKTDTSGSSPPLYEVWRAGASEYIATTLFVFYACGSAVAAEQYALTSAAANLLAAIIQGFAIASLVYAISHTSGGHINPAVTFSFVIYGHVGCLRGIFYIINQLLGAMTGAALLSVVVPNTFGTLGSTTLGMGTSPAAGFFFEFILTFGLLFAIFGTALSTHSSSSGISALAPIPIGFAITVGVGIAFSFTGGSLNPARSFGPAVVSGTWTAHYIYWAGPLLAALLVGLLERYVGIVTVGQRHVKEKHHAHKGKLYSEHVKQAALEIHQNAAGWPLQAVHVVLVPGSAPIPMIPMMIDPRLVSMNTADGTFSIPLASSTTAILNPEQ